MKKEKIGFLLRAVYPTRVIKTTPFTFFALIYFIIFQVLYYQNRFRSSIICRAPISLRYRIRHILDTVSFSIVHLRFDYRPARRALISRPPHFVHLSHITLVR